MYQLQYKGMLLYWLTRSNIQTDQEGERGGIVEGGIRGGRDWRRRVVLAKPKNIYRFTALPAVALANHNRRENTFVDFL
jgi:hypothetical protein